MTVCDRAHEELEPAPTWWHWSIPDPVEAGTAEAFDAVVADLDARIRTITSRRVTTRIGINGFGRMGRLVVRALRHHPELQLVHINEIKGDAATAAHLLEFDTVHGRYDGTVSTDDTSLTIDGNASSRTRPRPHRVPFHGMSTVSIW